MSLIKQDFLLMLFTSMFSSFKRHCHWICGGCPQCERAQTENGIESDRTAIIKWSFWLTVWIWSWAGEAKAIQNSRQKQTDNKKCLISVGGQYILVLYIRIRCNTNGSSRWKIIYWYWLCVYSNHYYFYFIRTRCKLVHDKIKALLHFNILLVLQPIFICFIFQKSMPCELN